MKRMTNYQRLARELRARKARHGQFISPSRALELVGLQITQGFRDLTEAREFLEELRLYRIETAGYTMLGDEVKTADLAWAIDCQETAVGEDVA